MKYAVTAATGNFGQTAVKELNQLVGAENVVVIARNEEKAHKLFPNNDFREGNYDDKTSMIEAFKGIDKVLFVSSQPGGPVDRATAQKNVVDALKEDGVEFVVYTSFPHAQTSTSALASDHRATENAIKDAGIAHAFLRNNWYLQNEMGFIQNGAANRDALYWANNRAGWALESDYAEAAAKVLVNDNPQEVYELAGESLTYDELGQAVKEATGNDFAIKQVSSDEYAKSLENAGLDQGTAALFTSFQEPINDGSLAEETDDLAKALGRPVIPIVDAIKTLLAN